jgi:Protein of unknown function (DUF2637)
VGRVNRPVLGGVTDAGPVVVLALIAAAGSFTHIRDTATEHGQHGWMAWAIAVCIDLTCVMAARDRQRDKHTRRTTGRISAPTLVLVGGILLSLAANLAQASPTPWGWITAGTPAGAFLVAVSMLERRKTVAPPADRPSPAAPDVMTVPPSFGGSTVPSSAPAPSSPWVVWEDDQPKASNNPSRQDDAGDSGEDERAGGDPPEGQTMIPVAVAEKPSSPAAPLLDFARRVASEHRTQHGRPITRDALRARLGVSNQLASDLLRQLRTETVA